jgi:hypothetical protein
MRIERLRERNRIPAVARFAHDFKSWLPFENSAQALPDHAMIIRQ